MPECKKKKAIKRKGERREKRIEEIKEGEKSRNSTDSRQSIDPWGHPGNEELFWNAPLSFYFFPPLFSILYLFSPCCLIIHRAIWRFCHFSAIWKFSEFLKSLEIKKATIVHSFCSFLIFFHPEVARKISWFTSSKFSFFHSGRLTFPCFDNVQWEKKGIRRTYHEESIDGDKN